MKQKYIGFFVAFLMVLILIPSGFALEQDNACGDQLTWTLEDGVLTISGTGAMWDYTTEAPAPWYSQKSSITQVVLQDGVTSIGNHAFWGLTTLSSATISPDVTDIGTGAFSGCVSLSALSLPGGLTGLGQESFSGTGIRELTIPGGVKAIGDRAFSSCGRLSRLTLRQGTKIIGTGAFEGCSYLTAINLPASIAEIRDYAFTDCYQLSNVYYGSTQTDWEAISLGEGNAPLTATDTTIHFGGTNCTHVLDQGSVTRQPSCTQPGLRTYTCTLCGNRTTSPIPLAAHNYAETVTLPTCTTQGYTTHTCSTCGNSYTDTYVDPAGHSWDQGNITTAATCTTEGVKTFLCKTCGQCKTEPVPLAAHSYTDTVTPPSCTQQGYTTHSCPCGHSYVDTYVEANGHSYTDTVTPPSCTQQGYTTHSCLCGESYIDTYVDPLPHNYDQGTITKDPTCTSAGEKTFTCQSCRGTKTQAVPPLDHDYDHGTITKDPTCTQEGEITYCCKGCGASYSLPKEKVAHHYTPTVTSPTCTEQGYTTHACSCGDSYVDSYVNPNGHSYSISVTPPTCTEQGYTIHACPCGESYVDSYVNPNGHSWDSGNITTAASCTNLGEKTFTCSGCGKTATETVPKTPHSYISTVTAPTCTAKGYTTHTCLCGETYVDSYVNPIRHSYDQSTISKAPTIAAQGTKTYHCTHCGHETDESIPPLGNPFQDVVPEHYFYAPVLWAADLGITMGMSPTEFWPDAVCTRAQVVTFLWRAAGKPTPSITSHSFTDVPSGSYYDEAMLWAVEQGITMGMSPTTFGPDDFCTRAQVVTFLWRAAGEPAPTIESHQFNDVDPQAYYYRAMLWAIEQGITMGMSSTSFGPALECTRAQVVTFLWRAYP